ncbi:MAG: hypothetical protein MJE77_31830 [Proteobacteria bacterium]|nr:hypothetical protein [Pseudomonadota bacterium]
MHFTPEGSDDRSGLARAVREEIMTATRAGTYPGAAAGRWLYGLLWIAVAVLLCTPIWLTSIPPLSELHDHLARLSIVSQYDSIASFRDTYRIDWGLYPNLAIELFGLPLLSLFSPDEVAKLFLTVTVLLWHSGTAMFSQAVRGRMSWRALIASFFVYNQQFLHGECNFVFSMGLCLHALSLWIANRKRFGLASAVAITLVATSAFVAHLFGFAIFVAATVAMTLSRLARRRTVEPNLVVGLLPLIPGTVLSALLIAGVVGSPPDLGAGVLYAPLSHTVRNSLTVLTGYDVATDIASVGVICLLAAIVLIMRTELAFRVDLLVAGLFVGGLYWVFPSDVAAGQAVNVHFALGAYLFILFSLDIRVSARVRNAIILAVCLLFAVRTGTTAAYWVELDREYRVHLDAFKSIDRGSAVYALYFTAEPELFNARRVHTHALLHTISMAALYREARVSSLVGVPGWHLLLRRQWTDRSPRFADDSEPSIPWDDIAEQYQYVWACRAPEQILAPLAARATLTAQTAMCRLYRL